MSVTKYTKLSRLITKKSQNKTLIINNVTSVTNISLTIAPAGKNIKSTKHQFSYMQVNTRIFILSIGINNGLQNSCIRDKSILVRVSGFSNFVTNS